MTEQKTEQEEKDEVRKELEDRYGQVWDTTQLQEDFSVISFMAPCVVVERKSDSRRGTLYFQHRPRFYWGWVAD